MKKIPQENNCKDDTKTGKIKKNRKLPGEGILHKVVTRKILTLALKKGAKLNFFVLNFLKWYKMSYLKPFK